MACSCFMAMPHLSTDILCAVKMMIIVKIMVEVELLRRRASTIICDWVRVTHGSAVSLCSASSFHRSSYTMILLHYSLSFCFCLNKGKSGAGCVLGQSTLDSTARSMMRSWKLSYTITSFWAAGKSLFCDALEATYTCNTLCYFLWCLAQKLSIIDNVFKNLDSRFLRDLRWHVLLPIYVFYSVMYSISSSSGGS